MLSAHIFRSQREIVLTENELSIAVLHAEISDSILLMDISDVLVWSVEEKDGGKQAVRESVLEAEDLMGPTKPDSTLGPDSVSGLALSQMEWKHAFSLHVPRLGRTFHLRALSYEECYEWIVLLKLTRRRAVKRYKDSLKLTMNQKCQILVRQVFSESRFQMALAFMLVLNFFINIAEAELMDQLKGKAADSSDVTTIRAQDFFDKADTTFTVLYTVELAFNMYGSWFRPFWANPWNWIDFVVVVVSILEAFTIEMQNHGVSTNMDLNVVRLVRIFRIVRILNKLKAMQRIVSAMACALVPVFNVFILLWMILSIYAIIGTNVFHQTHPNLFCKFSTSAFTMLQIAT